MQVKNFKHNIFQNTIGISIVYFCIFQLFKIHTKKALCENL